MASKEMTELLKQNDPKTLPLAGTRVVEFCNVAAGPFTGMLLADFGADVIKVEPPTGDMLRQWPPHTDGFSENFASLNRGKMSIALNLKDQADLDVARQLAAGADVIIENNRPGVMERLGLGYLELAQQNPRLVYCSISAFGQTGPRSAEGGFDVTIQAASGIMSVTGEPDGLPVKCGVPISDFAAGLYAAYAISSLLARVRTGGDGGYIDVPMLGTSLAIAALQTSEYFGTGQDPKPHGSAHPRNAPYRAFSARDRAFVIAAGNDKLWETVCAIVGRVDLIDDPRFLTVQNRAQNQLHLTTILNDIFSEREAHHWLNEFSTAGVPCSLINSYSEALSDPHVRQAGWVIPMELPPGRVTKTFACPIRINGVAPPVRRGPPELDCDREEVLALLK